MKVFFKSLRLWLLVLCIFAPVVAHADLLPSGYTRLEYIQSSGTQHIETGYTLTSNNIVYRWVAKDLNPSDSTSTSIFGSQNSATGKYTGILYGKKTSRTLYVGASGSLNVGYNSNDDNFHSWVLDIKDTGTVSLYKDGTLMQTKSYTRPVQNALPIALFGNNVNNSVGQKSSIAMKSFSITDNGVLKRKMIPVKNPSGAIGMYDTVNGVFYPNKGTGSFAAGPEVGIKIATKVYNDEKFESVQTALSNARTTVNSVVSNTISQSSSIGTLSQSKQNRPTTNCPQYRQCMLVQDANNQPQWFPIVDPFYDLFKPMIAQNWALSHNGSRVDMGYTQLDYIQSSGTQWINTNVYPTNTTAIETKFINNYQTSTTSVLVGDAWTSPKYLFSIVASTNAPNRIGGLTLTLTSFWTVGQEFVVYMDGVTGLRINGVAKPWSSGTLQAFTGTTTLKVFGDSVNAERNARAKMSYLKIWDNGSLVRNFIPAQQNSTGAIGMYDTVSGTFFGNSGSGNFTYGATVTNTDVPAEPVWTVVISGSEEGNTTHVAGTVYGTATCNSLSATANDVATSGNMNSSSWTTAGNNCWCALTQVDANGNAGIHENPAWVFNATDSTCSAQCATLCRNSFIGDTTGAFRGALSGIQ